MPGSSHELAVRHSGHQVVRHFRQVRTALVVARLNRSIFLGIVMNKPFSLVLLLALAGCASSGANFRPVVDLQGRDPALYEQNLRECQQYALQVAGAADQAAAGAVAGAVLGTAFAVIVGGGHRNTAAGLGALSGAASGAAAGERNQRSIISRCLAGRGFSVLN